jgi:hypothetical protein
MPKNFNDSIGTPQVGPGSFRETAYVDAGGDLEGLDKALAGAADLSNDIVLNSFNKSAEAEVAAQEEKYSRARALKRGVYDAALAKDEKAELEFQSKLEDLKIAERQGAISGSNSQIRQDTVLKNFVNRFPHLEDKFRKSYSGTRERADAARSQFEDPIEAGQDALIKEANAEGLSVTALLEIKRKEREAKVRLRSAEEKARFGLSIEDDIDDIFNSTLIPLTLASAQRSIAQTVENYRRTGTEYDANKIKADFIFRGELEAGAASQGLNDIIRTVGGKDAVLSREFRDSRVNQVRKVYADIANSGVFDSFDTLNSMERGMKIGTIQGLKALAKFSPLLAEAVKLDPKNGFEFVFKGFNDTLEVYKKGRRADLQNLRDKNANPIDSARLEYQIAVIDQWGQGELANDYTGFVRDGVAPPTSGDPEIDAAKTSILTKSVLGSSKVPPEQKTKAATAAIKAEQQYSKPGEYIGPSLVWYKDPVRAKVLQSDKTVQKEMTTAIDNSVVAMTVNKDNAELGKALIFAPQRDREDVNAPEKVYRFGGPFSAESAMVAENVGRSANLGLNPLDASPIGRNVKALNTMYWIRRKMFGPVDAENWAFEVLAAFKPEPEKKEKSNAG